MEWFLQNVEGDQVCAEKPRPHFVLSYDVDQVNVEDYVGLVIPRGRAPEYLRLNDRVIEIVQQFDNAQKPFATVCHGVQIMTGITCAQT